MKFFKCSINNVLSSLESILTSLQLQAVNCNFDKIRLFKNDPLFTILTTKQLQDKALKVLTNLKI